MSYEKFKHEVEVIKGGFIRDERKFVKGKDAVGKSSTNGAKMVSTKNAIRAVENEFMNINIKHNFFDKQKADNKAKYNRK